MIDVEEIYHSNMFKGTFDGSIKFLEVLEIDCGYGKNFSGNSVIKKLFYNNKEIGNITYCFNVMTGNVEVDCYCGTFGMHHTVDVDIIKNLPKLQEYVIEQERVLIDYYKATYETMTEHVHLIKALQIKNYDICNADDNIYCKNIVSHNENIGTIYYAVEEPMMVGDVFRCIIHLSNGKPVYDEIYDYSIYSLDTDNYIRLIEEKESQIIQLYIHNVIDKNYNRKSCEKMVSKDKIHSNNKDKKYKRI